MKYALYCILLVGGCGPKPMPTFTTDQLMDPAQCMQCHPNHFKQWSGSMHAYAADDPVFRAMNARGQRETNGMLGPFCVNCHAPLAVSTGMTKDGLNLDQVPAKLRGVTCFFCHSVDAVNGDRNNPLHLAGDGVLRGGIPDPVDNTAHHAVYSPLHDRQVVDSASLCGACHDIVNGNGVHLERTFAEWQGTLFSKQNARGSQLQTCGKCHMSGTANQVVANFPGVKVRTYHDHAFAAVDTALTDFPDGDEQKKEIADSFLGSLALKLCVVPNADDPNNTDVAVTLDSVGVGHDWPSGATQDRRAWVEVIASSGGKQVYASGVVADGQPATSLMDPDLLLLRDTILDGNGMETHNFWDAAKIGTSVQVPGAVTNDPSDPRYFGHVLTKTYTIKNAQPDKVTMRVRIQPVGLDVLDDLIATKDLDPSVRAKMGTIDIKPMPLEWDRSMGFGNCPTF